MRKFDEYVRSILFEDDVPDPIGAGGGIEDPGGMGAPGAPLDLPAQEPGPQDQQPPQEQLRYDKPYQDLGRVLYQALRTNWEDIPNTHQDRISRLTPGGVESIDSDEEGVALFKAVEHIISDTEGVRSYKDM